MEREGEEVGRKERAKDLLQEWLLKTLPTAETLLSLLAPAPALNKAWNASLGQGGGDLNDGELEGRISLLNLHHLLPARGLHKGERREENLLLIREHG